MVVDASDREAVGTKMLIDSYLAYIDQSRTSRSELCGPWSQLIFEFPLGRNRKPPEMPLSSSKVLTP